MKHVALIAVFFLVVVAAPIEAQWWRWFYPSQRVVAPEVGSASSVTQRDITWTFNANYEVGQFATGDWWVVGPVTITAISPSDLDGSAPHMHGSMINPEQTLQRQQGFDSRDFDSIGSHSSSSGYSSELDVAKSFPLVVPSGSSLLSSKSFVGTRPVSNVHYPFHESIEILTVLASAPSPGSFRPPYAGTDKAIGARWNTSFINYGRLNAVEPLPSTPSLETFLTYQVEPSVEITTGFPGRYQHPVDNYGPNETCGAPPNYGQCQAATWGAMLLAANLNYTNEEKEPIVSRIIQLGIDLWGIAQTGTEPYGTNTFAWTEGQNLLWSHGGGHNVGRLFPFVFAGWVLGDETMIAAADHDATSDNWGGGLSRNRYFQENCEFVYINALMVDWGKGYTSDMIGSPEWLQNGCGQGAQKANAAWTAAYRTIANNSQAPGILAMHLMGLTSVINYPAMFDYFDLRAIPNYTAGLGAAVGTTNGLAVYVRDLWAAYRDAPAPGLAPMSECSATPSNAQLFLACNSTGGVTEYRWYCSTTEGGPHSLIATTASPSYTWSGRSNGTAYYCEATAVVNGSESSPTDEFSGTPASLAPAAPAYLVANGLNGSVELSWPSSPGATSYHVKRSTTPGGSYTDIIETSSTTYDDDSASNETTYYYVVTAENGDGESGPSPEAMALPTSCMVSDDSWSQWQVFATQTGTFTITWEGRPSDDPIDGVVGLSNGIAGAYNDLAVIQRFNSLGFIDARNGGAYAADNSIAYTSGTLYAFRAVVDVAAKTYSLYVTPDGDSEVTVGANFAFRTQQASVTQLTTLTAYTDAVMGTAQHAVCSIAVEE